MLNINLSTILLQMANFFILAFILYRFLFKPLQNMMKKRELEITRTMDEEETARIEAEKSRQEYEEKVQNINAEIAARRNEARIVIEQTRQQMLREVKDQVNHVKAQTEETLARLRADALLGHKKEIGDLVSEFARKLMADLLTPNLQDVYQSEFVNKVIAMDLSTYVEHVNPNEKAFVKAIMASPLSEEKQDQLSEILHSQITRKFDLTFEVDPNLIAGGILRFENKLIDGSLGGQINKLQRDYQETV